MSNHDPSCRWAFDGSPCECLRPAPEVAKLSARELREIADRHERDAQNLRRIADNLEDAHGR